MSTVVQLSDSDSDSEDEIPARAPSPDARVRETVPSDAAGIKRRGRPPKQ